MLTIDEAFEEYEAHISALPTEVIPTQDALHRVLRADAVSLVDLPPFTQSAMDGYAVRASEATAGAALPVAMTLPAAGRETLPSLPVGTCARIFTGGPVPDGADAVVMQERVDRAGDEARFEADTRGGQNVRRQAEEIGVGEAVCETGATITAGRIGAMCAAGVGNVEVTRQPRVTLLVTGDEIVAPGTELALGQVYDCNTPMVAAWLVRRGIDARVARLPDDKSATEAGVKEALDESDLVITTGGVSVGEKDFVIGAARAAGVTDRFWKVAQKPGKPLYFGTREDCVFIGLPGNPAAVFIGLTVHVSRVLACLAGAAPPAPQRALTSEAMKRSPDRTIWHRCQTRTDDQGQTTIAPLSGQASHMLGNLSECTALARVRPGTGPLGPGSPVDWFAVD